VADFEAARGRRGGGGGGGRAGEEEPRERFARALGLVRRLEAGEAIGEAEAGWLASYRETAEWRSQLKMFETWGEAMLAR
jgi:hypothetical protein